MWLWNCSENMALFVFLCDFWTVPTIWHYLFFYVTLQLFRQYGIICFSIGLWGCSESLALFVFHFYIGLWNCSDSVALLFFLLGFGSIPSVWHYLFFYWTLELLQQSGIICCSIVLWNSSDRVSIICFSMGLWKYSHSVALLVYLLDFGTDQRV